MRIPIARFGALGGALAAAALCGCGEISPITAPRAGAGNTNFSVYAAMGTSITAGYQSGGLVDHHQVHSFAALFARQVGAAAFTEPTVSPDGLPPLLRIVSLSPLIVSNLGRTPGTPTNLAQPSAYHNMGIPGALMVDAVDSTYYYGGLPRGSGPFELIVRHRGTVLSEVASLAPTFVSVEYGANEVLAPATNGSGAVSVSPALFETLLHGALGGLQTMPTSPGLAVFTVPNVPDIPYFTTFPPFTVSLSTGQPVALLGPDGSLTPGDYVLLNAGADMAGGKGFPVGAYNYVNPSAPGTGVPLDDAEVLSATEAASITTTVDAYNTAIRAEAALAGAAVVDLHGLLETASTVGLRYQGRAYNADYITGGLFSLDGVHPDDLAQGFLANAMIAAVNATYGSSIPPVDLSQAATVTASRLGLDATVLPRYPVIQGGQAYYRAMFPPVAPAIVARR